MIPGGRFSRRERRTLGAIADYVAPGSQRFPLKGSAILDEMIAELVRPRARAIRLALWLALFLIDLLSLLRHGRTAGSLDEAKRARYLDGWAHAHGYFRRSLFRVVASLLIIQYYAQPEILAELGYRPEAVVAMPLRPPPVVIEPWTGASS